MTVYAPITPAADQLTAFFWDGAKENELRIQRCSACKRYQHPPEPVCRSCLSFALDYGVMSGAAVVYSYAVARQAFHPWFADKLPYVLAVVELVEQPNLRLLTNLVDFPLDSLVVGARAHVRFQQLADGVTLPVFGPAQPAEGPVQW